MSKKARIYMRINGVHLPEYCVFKGVRFKPDIFAFYLDNNLRSPVCPEVALEEGFTLEEKELQELAGHVLVGIGRCTREELSAVRTGEAT